MASRKRSRSTRWIQRAIKKPGSLRATAQRMGLIGKSGTLTKSVLQQLKARAKRTGNTKLLRRVNLAMTLGKLRRRKRR